MTLARMILGVAVLGVLGALGLGAPAAAQSRRYPPEPVDRDAEQAARSDLWNAAITPERHPYQDLIHGATEALAQRTADQTVEAIKKLDQAILLLPHEAIAYRLRGDAHLERREWAQCAADFAAADLHALRDDATARATTELHRKLGLCQARAGKLGDAERTLAETAASGNASGEVWMRLGEVRIAMGKLDEAIAALRTAVDITDLSAQSMIHFLLAAAYDRARRPALATTEATEGTKLDRQLTGLQNPAVPPIGAGEIDYIYGLVYSAEPLVRPELALAYFRRFVAAAPESPWRKRAEEHLRELKASELPEVLTRTGTAQLDLEAARAVVRHAMPALRACLARQPAVVVEVEISRAGPRTPATDRMRPRFFSPPDGVTVRRSVGELTDTELAAIDRCVQAIATHLALPIIKERDTYYKAMFYVVAL